MTGLPCEDVDFDEAVNVSVTDLVDKYRNENDLEEQILRELREVGKCRYLHDQSKIGGEYLIF